MPMGKKPQTEVFGDMASTAQGRLTELLAEMQALMRVLPVGAVAADPMREGRAEVIALSEEEAVEDGFDNMPL